MSSVPDRDPIRAGGWLPAGYRLGRYEVLSKLASGGMARVYVANAQGAAGFERIVAIKVLHSNLAYEEEFIRMFLDEARLAALIRHPNVVATIDISDTADTGYFLVMEYIEGDHLGALLANASKLGERMPMPVVLRIAIDALFGLAAAHDLRDEDGSLLNLVHRDVSPHNVLVGRDGVARLTDFGVAKAEDRLANTRDGQVKGKIAYMAPEQAAHGSCDSRSDLFAMAIVLWECATGQRLFRAENSAATLHRLLHEEIVPLSSLDPALAPLDAVLGKALERNPDLRFQSAEEFAEALERIAPMLGGVAPRRLVSRAVERYAAEKLERDRRLIETALVSLRGGALPRSEPAPAMPESSSPSRTQQRMRAGAGMTSMTPAAGTVPRLFTSARVPRMEPQIAVEPTGGNAPALRGGASVTGNAPALRGGASVTGNAPALRGGASVPREFALPAAPPPLGGGFDELLIVQARRRTRITRAVSTLALIGVAGVAGWLWYSSVRQPAGSRSTPWDVPWAVSAPSAPTPNVLPPVTTSSTAPALRGGPASLLEGTPAPTPVPTNALAHDLEQVVQPRSEHTAPPVPNARSGSHGRGDRAPTGRVPSGDGSGMATNPPQSGAASGTAPATPPVSPTWQLTPAPAAQDDGLLPNPYRHD